MSRIPPWFASILEEHFEELQMLWEQRLSMITDADYELEDLKHIDERIEAHRDALQLAGTNALEMLAAGLTGGDRFAAFASALVLLSSGSVHVESVLRALPTVSSEQAAGIRDALCYRADEEVLAALAPLLESEIPHVAAAIAEAAAFQRRLAPQSRTLATLLQSSDDDVRVAAWRTVSYVDAFAPNSPS